MNPISGPDACTVCGYKFHPGDVVVGFDDGALMELRCFEGPRKCVGERQPRQITHLNLYIGLKPAAQMTNQELDWCVLGMRSLTALGEKLAQIGGRLKQRPEMPRDILAAMSRRVLASDGRPLSRILMEAGAMALASWKAVVGSTLSDTSIESLLLMKIMMPEVEADETSIQGIAASNADIAELNQWQARWAQFGFPIFNVTHGLATSLLLTDCSGLKGVEFKPPFPSLLIQLPQGMMSFNDSDAHSEVIEAEYLSVHISRVAIRGQVPDFWAELSAILQLTVEKADVALASGWNLASKDAAMMRGKLSALITKWVEQSAWENCLHLRLLTKRGASCFARLPCPEYLGDLEAAVAKYVNDGDGTTSLDRAALASAARLVANLMLYIESQREPTNDTAPVPKGITPDTVKPVARWTLGREVKLPRELMDAAKDLARGSREARARWQVSSRFIVRGHWRNQAHGEGRHERKTIWIQPHWKGPEAGEALERIYDVALVAEREGKPVH